MHSGRAMLFYWSIFITTVSRFSIFNLYHTLQYSSANDSICGMRNRRAPVESHLPHSMGRRVLGEPRFCLCRCISMWVLRASSGPFVWSVDWICCRKTGDDTLGRRRGTIGSRKRHAARPPTEWSGIMLSSGRWSWFIFTKATEQSQAQLEGISTKSRTRKQCIYLAFGWINENYSLFSRWLFGLPYNGMVAWFSPSSTQQP